MLLCYVVVLCSVYEGELDLLSSDEGNLDLLYSD
jgi:hypothetical protein